MTQIETADHTPPAATRILPCPFCGVVPTIQKSVFNSSWDVFVCRNADCPVLVDLEWPSEEAIELWNTRVPDPRCPLYNHQVYCNASPHTPFYGEMCSCGAPDPRIAVLREALQEIWDIAEKQYPVSIGNQWAWSKCAEVARAALEAAKDDSE